MAGRSINAEKYAATIWQAMFVQTNISRSSCSSVYETFGLGTALKYFPHFQGCCPPPAARRPQKQKQKQKQKSGPLRLAGSVLKCGNYLKKTP